MSLAVVTWKWGTAYGPEYVNRLRRGLDLHLRLPFTFHLITDDPAGVDCDDRTVLHPMYEDHAGMKAGQRACLRRLRMFDRDMAEVLGPRVLHLDLDAVLVRDVTPLFDRADPLVLVKQGEQPKGRVVHNPSMVLMDAGVLHDMWAAFHADPARVWAAARAQNWACSDMSVINDYIHKNRATVKAATWGEADGVQAYWRRDNKQLNPGTRIVLFYGRENPSDAAVQAKSPWIARHWK